MAITPPAPPVISSFNPASGAVGTAVTINGSNFNSTSSSDIVFFGATMATVTSASTTSLTVTVPAGASYAPITVLNASNHLSGYSRTPFIVTFLGTGGITTSTFASPQTFSTGNAPQFVAVADIDGDGKADIVVVNQNDNTMGVFLNKSSSGSITSGSFAAEVTFSTGTGSYPNGIAIGDLDGDGKLDVVTANTGNASLSVFRNTSSVGNISFAAHADFATGNADPQYVAIADFDGDGKPDMAVTNEANVSVFHNTTTSGSTTISFAAHADFAVESEPGGIAVGDFDGDGKPDIAATISSDNYVSVLHNTSSAGTISFGTHADFSVGPGPGNLAVSDVDGDGKLDIVTSNGGDGSASILHNTSSSSISFGTHQDINVDEGDANESFYTVVMNDLDGDGKPDMIVVDNNDALYLLHNTSSTGSPSFGSKVTVAVGTNSYALYGAAIGDFDGDGKPDIVANAQGDNLIDVLRNKSAGIIPSPTTTSISSNNNPSFSASPGNSVTFTATVTHSGRPVTKGTVSFTSNGLAISGATDVAVNGSGQATANTSFSSTGSYTIVATFNGDVNYSSSVSSTLTQQVNLHPTAINSITATSTYSNASSIQFTATFAASITGLSTSNFSLTTTGAVSGASVASVSGSGTTYTVTVNTGTGDGTIGLNLANATGLTPGISTSLPFTGGTTTIDKTAPTVSISAPSVSSIVSGTGSVSYTVTYADANFNTSTLGLGDITLNSTGTASGTVGLTGSGTSYIVTISSISGSGSLGISIGAGTASDLAGNADAGAGPSATFTVVGGSDATLSALSISSGTLSPVFDAGTNGYTASVPYTASGITVTPTTNSPFASVTVNGTGVISGTASGSIALTVGANTITTIVTAQDGSTTDTYTLTVTMAAPATDATLSNLVSCGCSFDQTFAPGTNAYTASVPNSVNSITLTPTTNNPNATVSINGVTVTSGNTSGAIALNVGINTINTIVTAQDGVTTNTYSINVTRAPSSDATLSSLAMSSGALSPNFATGTTSYTASVSNAVSTITVTPTTNAPTATVAVNGVTISSGTASAGIPLTVGSNTITTTVTAQDGITTNSYSINVTRAASSDATLSSLAISAGTLSPAFASGTTSYTASVSNSISTITVTPTTNDPTATVAVNGVTVGSGTASAGIPLTVGTNTITTTVTAQDGVTTNTYSINVTRAPSSDATLSSLAMSAGTLSPAFATGTTSYTASVSNAVSSITVTPTANDPTATVVINGVTVSSGTASAGIPLTVGSNTITTTVTAQDGVTTLSYAINVTRAPSSDATLSSLAMSSGALSPNFATGTTSYTASVSNAVSTITVTPTANDPTATVAVNGVTLASGTASAGIPLTVGSNTITTTVTAQDGVTTLSYAINVTRAPSSDATLSSLVISAGTLSPNFATGTTSYTASVSNAISTITVTPTTNDPTATVAVNGVTLASGTASAGIPLTVGTNTITTLVTAQDGVTTLSYAINVTRAPSSNATLSSLVMSAGTLSPNFATGITSYTASVANSTTSVTLTPIINNTNGTITVNGAAVTPGTASAGIPLAVGPNTVTMIVTAQDGITTRTYSIIITRAKSTNANLANLTLSSAILSPAFATGTNSYSVSVGNATASVTVTPTASDATATLNVNGVSVTSGTVSGSIGLAVGPNIINTVVTAQDGVTTRTYTITVTRAASTNALLSAIKLTPASTLTNTGTAGTTTTYTTSVSNAISSVTVTPTSIDPTATIKVNGVAVISGTASGSIALAGGPNTINTVVTAQDGITTRTYSIIVTRAKSNNAALANLTISNGTLSPAFLTGTNSYTASVSNAVSAITVTPTTGNSTATVKVNGITVISGTASAGLPLIVGPNTLTTIVTAQDGITTNTYTIIVTRAASSDATLSNLAMSSGTLSPAFAVGTTSYTAGVANATSIITLTPTTGNAAATVKVNGVAVTSGTASAGIPLVAGPNTINTVVTAQNGTTTETYTIIVTRAPSANAALANITISSGALSPAFATGTTSYTASVSNATTSVKVTPTTADATATVTVNGIAVTSGTASGSIALVVGPNTITTKVTAQDGTTTDTYTVTITRLSSNALLSAIKLTPASTLTNTGTVGSTTTYTTSVSNAVASVTVTATTVDPTATIKVNGVAVTSGTASGSIALVAGPNTINTVVTAQDGTTTKTYSIIVTRAKSTNAALANLAVSAGTLSPVFATGTYSYTASVSNATTSVKVTPTTSDATATVTVNGTTVTSGTASAGIPLAVGPNTLTTIVTAQDGVTTKTYTITVTRAPSTNALLSGIKLTPASTLTNTGTVGSTTTYTTSVSNAVASVTVTATSVDPTATIKVNGVAVTSGTASGSIALAVGSNTINTVVTAQDGVTTRTYSIIVTRAGGPVNNLNQQVSVEQTPMISIENDGILVHQALSPNGDGINDFLVIEGIKSYPENKLTIINRNGALIFEARGYDNSSKVFDGHASTTGAMQVPGTYFYALDYNVNGITKHKTGFIILKY